MTDIDRRTALALGLAAASSLVVGPSEIALAAVGEETKLAEGVTVKVLGEGMSMIPGYVKVRLRDLTVQPGATVAPGDMKNAMACHITKGEMEINQDGKTFTGPRVDMQDWYEGRRNQQRSLSRSDAHH